MGDLLWGIIPWGYRVLVNVEEMRNGLMDTVFLIITNIGNSMTYFIILTFLYWCVRKPVGQGFAYTFLLTGILNTWIKDIWCIPRPDDPALMSVLEQAGITLRLNPLMHVHNTSPSFVSGHTQMAVVLWGYMAFHYKKIWFWVMAVMSMALIGFSRMYVGVHFPQDVIGGLLVGVFYLILWLLAEPYLRVRLISLSLICRYALAVLIPLIILMVHPVGRTATPVGLVIGLGVGFLLEGQHLDFSAGGKWRRRVLRGALGLVVLFALFLSLRALSGPIVIKMSPAMKIVWHVILSALFGFVVALVAPWLFTVTRLAQRENKRA